MSTETHRTPNPVVRRLYDRLGELLDESDDAFVEHGPALLRAAIRDPDFFDGVSTEQAPTGTYTRRKVVGDEGEHVIRFMEWPPGYALVPHEHHGRPCFEVLVDGLLTVVNMRPEELDDGLYELTALDTEVVRPGETTVVDPRVSDVHAVYSPVRSRSLHVYPDDASHAFGYCLIDESSEDDRYRRLRFDLDCDD
ncbi:hypothetical protein SAMN04487950_1375 [Halogranum rubrum]|uniref:Cysteine dioxygenase type I n=1 Tax=Halogranum rubrum TaxID=553466 RepID=A0A1I4CV55_9EURY|nr:hypothetical protein [Halogranum rubrum]SFK84087.1 hypothetical protein SAMN04487950_1375 [Halogranum rubrum]